MSRDTLYKFVETDIDAILTRLVSRYEELTGRTLRPADPDRVFMAWVAEAILQERVCQNYVGNQNLPSRAEGENLDAIGEMIYGILRLAAQPSQCTVRFTISEAQVTSIAIPQGTRVTDASGNLIWATTEDAVIPIGSLYADVLVQCETAGEIGNGYVAGQINTLVDVDNILFYSSCENITTASGGSDEETDDQYYEFMREGLDAYSTAGPVGAYTHWAKSVSSNIADVKPIQPRLTLTKTIPLYTDGDGKKHGFLAGEHLISTSVIVCASEGSTPAVNGTDYSYEYEDQLLNIEIKAGGALASQTSIYVTVDCIKAGYVYLYALMADGTLADATVKAAIAEACNQDTVRPLTDFVSVEDAELVTYNISLTYWIDRKTTKSLADIQTDVTAAVNEYVAWQSGKIGRDINPSYLEWLLKDTGVKRVAIVSPPFIPLRNGDDHTVPQVAQIGSVSVVNGGFEDE